MTNSSTTTGNRATSVPHRRGEPPSSGLAWVTAKNRVPALLCLLLMVQSFIPAGYMPASVAGGWLVMLCPDGLPVGYLEATGPHGAHDHPAHQEDAVATDYCPLGSALETPALVAISGVSIAKFAASGQHLFLLADRVGSAPQYRHHARAPPTA